MSPRRSAFLLWLLVLVAPAVLAAEPPPPAPQATESSLPKDLYLIAVGSRSALTERYLHSLCKRLSADPHGRQRFHRARILRHDSRDLKSIKEELGNLVAGVPSRTATNLGVFLDALKRDSVDCLAQPFSSPAGGPAADSPAPDTERPTLMVMAESITEKVKAGSIGGDKVDEVGLVRFLLDPGAPPGERKRLEPVTYVEGEDADALARKMGLAMLELPDASLFDATPPLVKGNKYLPCTAPTRACGLPGDAAKLVLVVRDTPWLAAHEVSASFRAHCDTPDHEALKRFFDKNPPSREDGPGTRRFSLEPTFHGVGSCAFEARLSEPSGQHVALVSGARLEVKAAPLLVSPWDGAPVRTNYLLAQRRLVPWASVTTPPYSDDKQLTEVRLLSGEEILLLGQRLRESLLRLGAPPDVPELTATLNGHLAQRLESFHDSLGYIMMGRRRYAEDAASEFCDDLKDSMVPVVRAHQMPPEYIEERWWPRCSSVIIEVLSEQARVLEQREKPRLRVSRLPGQEHLPYRAIENLRDARSVEVKAEDLQFTQRLQAPFRAEEQYLVSASTDSGESSRPMLLHVESDAGPSGFELGSFLRYQLTEEFKAYGVGVDFQFRALDAVLLATMTMDLSYQWPLKGLEPARARDVEGVAFGLMPSLGVDISELVTWNSANVQPTGSFSVGYDLLRRSAVFTMNAGILMNRRATSYFNRSSGGVQLIISTQMHFTGPPVTSTPTGMVFRVGVLF